MWSRKKKHADTAQEAIARAEAALETAIQDKKDAEDQVSWRERLQEGWERVHERNNLSELFVNEYRSTR